MQESKSLDRTSRASEPLVAELQEYRRQFEAIIEDTRELLAGLTDAQFNWRIAPGSWSIAECLAHLNVTGQLTLQSIDHSLKKVQAQPETFNHGPFRRSLLGRLAIWGIEPPAKIKVKAPKLFTPLPEHLMAVVAPAFMSLHEQLLRRLQQANGLDLARIKVTSAASSLIKMNLGQTIAFLAAHERRHLWQARQVKNNPGFPRSQED